MRILFLTHRFPQPRFGSQVRTYNTIRHLARSHDVTVLAPVRSAEEQELGKSLATDCGSLRAFRVFEPVQLAKMAITLPTPITASEAYFHSFSMAREAKAALASGSFDMVFVHCSSVGRLVERGQGVAKFLDLCDVDSQKWLDYASHRTWPLSWGCRWEATRLAAAERRLASRFDHVTVATPAELGLLRAIGVTAEADCFPQGVDTEYFTPIAEAYDPWSISFIGRMDYFPNEQAVVDFCRDVWPELRRTEPRLKFQIVGAAPTARVRKLSELEGVTVTGSVPDVRPIVTRSALSIVPLKIARGTQTKILESMAMGVPVVASQTSAGGVDAIAGEHFLAASTTQEYRDAILRVVRDRSERERLAMAGRARVISHHSWSSVLMRLDSSIDRCLRSFADRRGSSKVAESAA